MATSNSKASEINRAKQELTKVLADEEGFVGAGLASTKEGNLVIVVQVRDSNSAVLSHVPKTWKGFKVRTEAVGTPRQF